MKRKWGFSMALSRGVVIATENVTAVDIAQLMKEQNVGAVVIMKGEELVGIVSERDIVRRVVSKDLVPRTTKAKDFMTKEVVTVEFKGGLNKIYQTLRNVKFRHLPIMDRGKLVGIVSQRDVLYGLAPKKR